MEMQLVLSEHLGFLFPESGQFINMVYMTDKLIQKLNKERQE